MTRKGQNCFRQIVNGGEWGIIFKGDGEGVEGEGTGIVKGEKGAGRGII
jgi:hypothetical protein